MTIEQRIDEAVEQYGPSREMPLDRVNALAQRENETYERRQRNAVASTARENRALDLLIIGATYAQIAKQLNLKTASGARSLVLRALEKRAAENKIGTEQARVVFTERLELLYRRWMPEAMGTEADPRSAKVVLDILTRYAEINGLKQPATEVNVNVNVQGAAEKREAIIQSIAAYKDRVIDGEVTS
jgi:DNA-binding CsgD family transcriptional regulator